jgi:hypothetical protein
MSFLFAPLAGAALFVVAGPAILAVPGFTAVGPVAGSFAAWAMANLPIAVVAPLQSAAMSSTATATLAKTGAFVAAVANSAMKE